MVTPRFKLKIEIPKRIDKITLKRQPPKHLVVGFILFSFGAVVEVKMSLGPLRVVKSESKSSVS